MLLPFPLLIFLLFIETLGVRVSILMVGVDMDALLQRVLACLPLSTSDSLEVTELREGSTIELGSTSLNIFSSVTSDTEGLHIDVIE